MAEHIQKTGKDKLILHVRVMAFSLNLINQKVKREKECHEQRKQSELRLRHGRNCGISEESKEIECDWNLEKERDSGGR